MNQDKTPDPAMAEPSAKVAPEQVTLRAQPRPVTRLNRRILMVLVGGVATAVLGATLWSLQTPQRRSTGETAELYNVDRVSRSEELARLPADYSQLPPTLPPEIPLLGEPLPGDLGAPILRAEQQAMSYSQPGYDRAEAGRLRNSRKLKKRQPHPCFSIQEDNVPPPCQRQ